MIKFLRNVFYSKQIAREQERQWQIAQEHALKSRLLLISIGNALHSNSVDPSKVRSSTTYKRCAEIIDLLSPMDVLDAKFVRLGKDGDGGYVMVDDFDQSKIEAAYSFGILDDVSWDEAIANRGIDVFMYDHTIGGLPKENPRFHFFKTGVAGLEGGPNLKTLDALIAENRHQENRNMLLKMDIEGYEWDVFRQLPSSNINQFRQIVLEFHQLTPFGSEAAYNRIVEVLRKINQTHQAVHIHGNNWSVPAWIGDLVLPDFLEVSYVRRGDFKERLAPGTRQFPTDLDMPAFKDWPDIYFANFGAGAV
jgi:hypothetical protein